MDYNRNTRPVLDAMVSCVYNISGINLTGLHGREFYSAVQLLPGECIVALFNAGFWVPCEAVYRCLNVSYQDSFDRYEFGRTVEWNASPLNGQFIKIAFRLPGSEQSWPYDWF